jgi:hypothetical protein
MKYALNTHEIRMEYAQIRTNTHEIRMKYA